LSRHGGSEWERLLNIDSVAYRSGHEAAAMVQRIQEKAAAAPPPQATAAAATSTPCNTPGRWDFYLCHGQRVDSELQPGAVGR
jgi:hypothetical protein